MAECPVCGTEVGLPEGQPTVKDLPSIPVATDLTSALAAINAMRQQAYVMRTPVKSQAARTTGGSKFPTAGSVKGKKQEPRWKEVTRVTETVKVYNPDDNTQFIEVERINSLVMQNTVTKETWMWSR